MALKLGAARRWRDLTLDDFAAVADRAHVDPDAFANAAAETAERFGDIWADASKSLPVPGTVKSAIEAQRATVPAITGTPPPADAPYPDVTRPADTAFETAPNGRLRV